MLGIISVWLTIAAVLPPALCSPLCDALATVHVGESTEVCVSGIYDVGLEHSVLYDPVPCVADVQPETWVVIDDHVSVPELTRTIERYGRARVTFIGTLVGPKRARPDTDLLQPTWMTIPHRLTGLTYGHNGHWRTELVVHKVVAVTRVPDTVLPYARQHTARTASKLPVLVSAAIPLYPEAARSAGIAGTVYVDVRVQDGKVVESRRVSGDRLLADEALRNVSTWQFAARTGATLRAMFVYSLEDRKAGDDQNTRICGTVPTHIEIVAPSERW